MFSLKIFKRSYLDNKVCDMYFVFQLAFQEPHGSYMEGKRHDVMVELKRIGVRDCQCKYSLVLLWHKVPMQCGIMEYTWKANGYALIFQIW